MAELPRASNTGRAGKQVESRAPCNLAWELGLHLLGLSEQDRRVQGLPPSQALQLARHPFLSDSGLFAPLPQETRRANQCGAFWEVSIGGGQQWAAPPHCALVETELWPQNAECASSQSRTLNGEVERLSTGAENKTERDSVTPSFGGSKEY